MTTQAYIRLGRKSALTSFLVGTCVFLFYYLTSSFELLFVGYVFILLAGLVNFAILLLILIKALRYRENRYKLFLTSLLLLLNIPIMLIYSWVSIILTDTMRITFNNETRTKLVDINISGCEAEYIGSLDVGESKTVWISVPTDCAIDIHYELDGKRKTENVAGYTTNGMGQKMEYSIGRDVGNIFEDGWNSDSLSIKLLHREFNGNHRSEQKFLTYLFLLLILCLVGSYIYIQTATNE